MMKHCFYGLVDWGTSSFRLWLVDRAGSVLAESKSDEGMMKAREIGFSEILEKHLQKLSAPVNLPVVISGMVGAKQGWCEAPYLSLPTSLEELAKTAIRVPYALRDVRIISGIAQMIDDHPDVMRGEETQLAGLVETMPNGIICMPGTHCKWVDVKDSQVTGFTSFMTGELFSILSQHSILKHAINHEVDFTPDNVVFIKAYERGLEAPEQVLGWLFQVRASQLLGFEEKNDGAAHLSGLLIGAEIGVAKHIYDERQAGLVASPRLNQLYQPVMEKAGFNVCIFDGEKSVRAGLFAAALTINAQDGEKT